MFCQKCGTEVPDGSSFCGTCGNDLGATTPLAAIRELARPNEIDIIRAALKNDYEVEKELGRGGMAVVYKAREIMLDREVALKVLPFSLAFDQEFVERFQREARTSASLEHPNIIPIYRVGKSDNVIYFAMKFLRGQALAEVIEQRGKLPPTEIRKLLIEAANALGYAHKHDIVHRDIKPDNIMFKEGGGQAVVCDFGIAKAASGTKLTGTGMAIGTPYYMSPEQARAQPLDGRSDLYSLGVVAFQCMTGTVPFDGEDSFSIGYKHIMEELRTPPLHTGEERALFEVIRKMMAKDPDHRFQRAEDLVLMLSDGGPTAQAIPVISEAAATGASPAAATTPIQAIPGVDFADAPTGAAPVATGSQPTPTTPMPRESMERAGGARKKKSRRPVLVGALAFLLVGGGGGAVIYTQVMGGQLPFMPSSQEIIDTDGPVDTPPAPGEEPIAAVNQTNPIDAAARDTTSTEPAVDTTAAGPATPAVTPDSPPAEPPTPVRTTGTVALQNLPSGARVFINGQRVQGATHTLQPGRFQIRVERDGYQNFETFVQVTSNQRTVVPVVLTALPVRPVTQCADWDNNTYNADGSCFAVAPRFGPQVVPLVAWAGSGRPSPVTLIVEVRTDGTPGRIYPEGAPENPEFMVQVLEFARVQQYQPARGANGQPVVAFWKFQFRPQ